MKVRTKRKKSIIKDRKYNNIKMMIYKQPQTYV
jgi:hypothetical protein